MPQKRKTFENEIENSHLIFRVEVIKGLCKQVSFKIDQKYYFTDLFLTFSTDNLTKDTSEMLK